MVAPELAFGEKQSARSFSFLRNILTVSVREGQTLVPSAFFVFYTGLILFGSHIVLPCDLLLPFWLQGHILRFNMCFPLSFFVIAITGQFYIQKKM